MNKLVLSQGSFQDSLKNNYKALDAHSFYQYSVNKRLICICVSTQFDSTLEFDLWPI